MTDELYFLREAQNEYFQLDDLSGEGEGIKSKPDIAVRVCKTASHDRHALTIISGPDSSAFS